MKRTLIAPMMLSQGMLQAHWHDESKCRGYIGPVEFTAVLRESSISRRSERTLCLISVALYQKMLNILDHLPQMLRVYLTSNLNTSMLNTDGRED